MGFNQNSISTSPKKSNICVDQSDLQTRNGDRPKRIFHVKRIPEQERIEWNPYLGWTKHKGWCPVASYSFIFTLVPQKMEMIQFAATSGGFYK